MRRFFLFFSILALPFFAWTEEIPQAELTHTEEVYTPLDPQNFKVTFFKTLTLIVLALGIVFFLLWLVKRFSNQRFSSLNHQKHIKIIEKRPISPKTMLYVVEIAGSHLLVAESQLEIKLLSKLEKIN
ncbi:MAG: flagellar biosynthetic protein FliO [Simkaniaceae bacterium]|nr:flagellar biosynthetic protein FliO [Simkaniaceae bacterium]MCF7852837.1 flagellar biosynthetic protein FliO [Simkaniaceae bacterium]